MTRRQSGKLAAKYRLHIEKSNSMLPKSSELKYLIKLNYIYFANWFAMCDVCEHMTYDHTCSVAECMQCVFLLIRAYQRFVKVHPLFSYCYYYCRTRSALLLRCPLPPLKRNELTKRAEEGKVVGKW